MKNLNVSEKSKGVVLFAFNTDTVDYVHIANQAARLIYHTLNLPTTIITDSDVTNTLENCRTGYAAGTQWRNGDRYRAYELTPYDETLLLDSDYLQFDDSLLKLFDSTIDYRVMYNNRFMSTAHVRYMGSTSLPFVWATAVLFKKTEKSRQLFELVGRIQRNYSYYMKLYNIIGSNFRNDYAFAIANNIINGYTQDEQCSIPGTMLTFDKSISNIEISDKLIVRGEDTAYILPKQNIHIMDKDYLLSDKFSSLVDIVCNT